MLILLFPVNVLFAGIPEPGVTFYGTVTNNSGTRLTSGTMEWTIISQADNKSIKVSVNLSDVNGQYSYIAEIPFESAVNGNAISANALPAPTGNITYTHTVYVNGKSATILSPAQDNFTVTQSTFRGQILKVDLLASGDISTPTATPTPGVTPTPIPSDRVWTIVDLSRLEPNAVDGYVLKKETSITAVPTDNAFSNATDGIGLQLDLKPGEGTLFIASLGNIPNSLLEMKVSVRSTSNEVQMGMVAIAADANGNPDGSLGYVNPTGNEVSVNKWGLMRLKYSCPTTKFYPAIQFVLPKESSGSQTVYVDQFMYSDYVEKTMQPVAIAADSTFDTITASLEGLNPYSFLPDSFEKGSISLTNGYHDQGLWLINFVNEVSRIGCYFNAPSAPAFVESRVFIKRNMQNDDGMTAMVIVNGEQTIAYYIKASQLPYDQFKEIRVGGNFEVQGLFGPMVLIQHANTGKENGKIVIDDLKVLKE